MLPQRTYSLAKVSQVLDEFTTITGFVWNVDYAGVLTMWDPGVVAAPFDILDSNAYAIGDITVEPIATEYATTVLLLCGDSSQRAVADSFTGDGAHARVSRCTIRWSATPARSPSAASRKRSARAKPGSWRKCRRRIGPTYTLVRAIGSAPGVGVAIVFPYTAQFPLLIRVDDAAAVALVGGYIERLIQEPGIFHYDQAVAVAERLSDAGHAAAAGSALYDARRPAWRRARRKRSPSRTAVSSGAFFITDVETRMRDPLLLSVT